ncbi:MAG: succinate dehydrogenase assembly factor 2 [Gammaproteobacteria bacterium]|nr:succinate dehydrogenase assembly factor 2 [Gammaproteobacteria bacterium]MDD9958301.1 succinate dehydrogenase assembly factor 2 [Gammaproteobacteria bacterium]
MQQLDKQKIFWHSRRGMLELDLLLVPFANDVFSDLNTQDQLLYERFLEEEDQDLFAWLMGTVEPQNKEYLNLIAKILAHSKQAT